MIGLPADAPVIKAEDLKGIFDLLAIVADPVAHKARLEELAAASEHARVLIDEAKTERAARYSERIAHEAAITREARRPSARARANPKVTSRIERQVGKQISQCADKIKHASGNVLASPRHKRRRFLPLKGNSGWGGMMRARQLLTQSSAKRKLIARKAARARWAKSA